MLQVQSSGEGVVMVFFCEWRFLRLVSMFGWWAKARFGKVWLLLLTEWVVVAVALVYEQQETPASLTYDAESWESAVNMNSRVQSGSDASDCRWFGFAFHYTAITPTVTSIHCTKCATTGRVGA